MRCKELKAWLEDIEDDAEIEVRFVEWGALLKDKIRAIIVKKISTTEKE